MEGFDTVSTRLSAFDSAEFLASCSSATIFVKQRGRIPRQCLMLASKYSSAYNNQHIAPHALWREESVCMNTVAACRPLLAGKGVARGGGDPGNSVTHTSCDDECGSVNATEPCCPVHAGRCSRDNHCNCNLGYEGSRCELPCKLGCVNECSGRGECLAAWCRCQQGWFGIDCSISGSQTSDLVPGGGARDSSVSGLAGDSSFWRAGTPIGPTLPPPRSVDELRIYVYDVAPDILQSEPCPFGCGALCGNLIYKSNIFFLSSLLKDPVHRTNNPNEAHLFLAPQLPYRYSGNGGDVGPHMLDTVDDIWGMGYFSRNGGRDHIWWVVSDIGTCEVPARTYPGIILGHYGRLDARLDSPYACMDPQKDLVIPPMTSVSKPQMQFVWKDGARDVVYVQPGGVQQARVVHEGKGPSAPRPMFLFMAAGNREMLDKACADTDNNSKGCRDNEYAMGARAAIFSWFREHAAWVPDIAVLQRAFKPDQYYAKLRSSRFCLDALGYGFSTRIVDYVISGCIPVIVRDDVLWPYESFGLLGDETWSLLQDNPSLAWGGLPRVQYKDFAVLFRKREIPNMLETLRGISDERVRELQAGCRRVHKAFLWDQTYGMAYNYTIAGLAWLRAKMQL
eukprot:jgi/Mesvir1/18685/Mv17176-RA.2